MTIIDVPSLQCPAVASCSITVVDNAAESFHPGDYD